MTPALTRRARLSFGGLDLDVFDLDGQQWIRKDQLAAAAGCALSDSPGYYSRYFSAWATFMADIGGEQVRMLTPYAAARVLARTGTSEAFALSLLVSGLDPQRDPPSSLEQFISRRRRLTKD